MENITQGHWFRGPSSDLGEPIDQSLRFQNGQRLVGGDTQPTGSFTYSCWFKPAHRPAHSGRDAILMFGPNQSYQIGDPDTAQPGGGRLMVVNTSISGSIGPLSNGDLNDISAWYHIVIINESSTSRCYINGVRQTSTAATPSGSSVMTIGSNSNSNQDDPLSGYLAEVNLLDGTVVGHTANSDGLDIIDEFGRYNEDGIWVPKKIEFTAAQYGAKGFRLQFNDTSNLGDDSAPVGSSGHTATNDFTATGFGAADDDIQDTPTNNMGVLNSHGTSDSVGNYQAGNLEFETDSNGTWQGGRGTFPMQSGKWYWEATCGQDDVIVGVTSNRRIGPGYIGSAGEVGFQDNGNKYNASATGSSYGSTFKAGDVIGVAFDADNGNIWFSVNGTWQDSATAAEIAAGTTTNAAFTSLASNLYVPAIFNASAGTNTSFNFGQASFSNTPPTGYKALATENLPKPTITKGNQHFGILKYSAPGSPSYPITINGSGGNNGTGELDFDSEPGLVWIKMTNGTENHILFDSVRGASKSLRTDENSAEADRTNFAFATNGFTFSASDAETYQQNDSYIAYCWKGGGTAVSNSNGSETSSVSANTKAGFSIVKWTPDDAAGTVGHGLSQAPEMILLKGLNNSTWYVYHHAEGATHTQYASLSTDTEFAASSAVWNNTAPTSTVFSVGSAGNMDRDGEDAVAYCWHGVEGYSQFGTYYGTGNNNGTYVNTGFKPAFVMIKGRSNAGNWNIYDTVTNTSNPADNLLRANLANAEATESAQEIDILSNGFKLKGLNLNINETYHYVYMAFAENPFGGEDLAPATAH